MVWFLEHSCIHFITDKDYNIITNIKVNFGDLYVYLTQDCIRRHELPQPYNNIGTGSICVYQGGGGGATGGDWLIIFGGTAKERVDLQILDRQRLASLIKSLCIQPVPHLCKF